MARLGLKYVQDLVGKSPDRTPFRRPRHRCTENIKIYRNGIGYEKVDRTDQDQGRDDQRDVVKPVINFQLPGHLLSEKRLASQETFCPMQLFSYEFFLYMVERESVFFFNDAVSCKNARHGLT